MWRSVKVCSRCCPSKSSEHSVYIRFCAPIYSGFCCGSAARWICSKIQRICSGFKIRLLIGISIRILWPSPVSRSPPCDGRGIGVGVSSVRRASELDRCFGWIVHGVRLADAAARRAGFVDAHGGWRVGLVFCSD